MFAIETLIAFHTQGRADGFLRTLPDAKLATAEFASRVAIARLQALLAPVGTWS